MSEPSERIRAALLKATSTRPPTRTTSSEAPDSIKIREDPNSSSSLPNVAISAENLEALLGSGTPKDPRLLPAVEVMLPMLSADDRRPSIGASSNDSSQSQPTGAARPQPTAVPQFDAPLAIPRFIAAEVADSGNRVSGVTAERPDIRNGITAGGVTTVDSALEDMERARAAAPVGKAAPSAPEPANPQQDKVSLQQAPMLPAARPQPSGNPPVTVTSLAEKSEPSALVADDVDRGVAPDSAPQNAIAPEHKTRNGVHPKTESLATENPVTKNPATTDDPPITDKPDPAIKAFAADSSHQAKSSAPTNNIGSTLFAESPTPETEEEIARRQSRTQFFRWIAPGVILLLLAGGMTAYLLVSRQPKTPPNGLSAQSATTSPLHLDAQMQASGQVNVRWNSADNVVKNAREGRLVVTELDQPPRIVPLSREELAIGHFLYQPSTERMELRLEVADQVGIITQESVLAMTSRAAAADAPLALTAGAGPVASANQPNAVQTSVTRLAVNPSLPTSLPVVAVPSNPASTAQIPIRPVPASVATPPSAAPAAPNSNTRLGLGSPAVAVSSTAPPAAIPPDRPAPRMFSPPTQQASEPIRTVILEPPSLGYQLNSLPAGVAADDSLSGISAPPPSETPRQIRVGGNIQSGLLVKRVTPEYPGVAQSARVQGVVRFSATIGKDGRIQNLKAIGGPSLLIPPALNAVKQWIYRPTLLNGQPVEVVTQIEVNFTLGQ